MSDQRTIKAVGFIIGLIGSILTIFIFVTGVQKLSDLYAKTQLPPSPPFGPSGYTGSSGYTGQPITENGQLTVYKTCNTCPDLSVSIDGVSMGNLLTSFADNVVPTCNSSGTITKTVTAGKHTIMAKDGNDSVWNIEVIVPAGGCFVQKISKVIDTTAGPWGDNGKVTFYKTCVNCPDLAVSIDGNYLGTLTQTFSVDALVACDAPGTVSLVLRPGEHRLAAKDSYGMNWDFPFTVIEKQCGVQKLEKPNDVPPNAATPNYPQNPYGQGGQLTIYENCSNCNDVQISIDGNYVGSVSAYFQINQTPTCGAVTTGSIVKTLTAGTHYISAKDASGDTWNGYATVQEAQCTNYAMQGFTQKYIPATTTNTTYVGTPSPTVHYVNPPPPATRYASTPPPVTRTTGSQTRYTHTVQTAPVYQQPHVQIQQAPARHVTVQPNNRSNNGGNNWGHH